MSDVGFILDRLAAKESAALSWREQAYSGSWICRQTTRELEYPQKEGVCAGAVVLLEADYSARTVAMLLALAELRTIPVPLLPATLAKLPSLVEIAIRRSGSVWRAMAPFPLAGAMRIVRTTLCKPLGTAIVRYWLLFTSGSTAQPKAVLHNFGRLLAKFRKPRPALTTLDFSLFDHWEG